MALKKTSDRMSPSLSKIQRQLANVPARTYNFFVSVTPKDTGNARNKTILRGSTIQAKYPYARRLDQGWSPQAKQGMVKPTVKFLTRLLNSIIRK